MSRIEKVEEEMQTLAIKELDKLIGESLWDLKPSLNLLSWDVARDGSIIATGETRLLALKNAIERLRGQNEQEEYEIVDHPQHYGGAEARHEAISVIEEWDLGFHLGNVVKYISRAGKKPDQTTISDLKKARWYLDRYIERMENK